MNFKIDYINIVIFDIFDSFKVFYIYEGVIIKLLIKGFYIVEKLRLYLLYKNIINYVF